MMNYNKKKRVLLNRRSSSLLLDYRAMIPTNDNTEQEQVVTNEYTRKLIASALSLSSISPVKITTTSEAAIEKQPSPFLLKSSLRSPKSASAPCSPTTTTGIKSVHFNKHNLEDICLFRKAQTPSTISQKNIFWAKEDDDSSSSSSSSDEESTTTTIKSLIYENWPTRLSDIIDKKNKVIQVEKNTIRLMTNGDDDDDLIVGKILVKNLDYHKTVTIRFSFDYWETIENSKAIFINQQQQDCDVFSFNIKLPFNATRLYFAVHYKVGNQEYWDNNRGRNYEIQIKTSNKTTTTKQDTLKSRYDFSTCIHQAKNTPPAKSSTTSSSSRPPIIPSFPRGGTTTPTTIPIPIRGGTTTPTTTKPIPITRRTNTTSSSSSPTGLSCHSPLASSPSFMDLNSKSYMELVNKYCFYSTSPTATTIKL